MALPFGLFPNKLSLLSGRRYSFGFSSVPRCLQPKCLNGRPTGTSKPLRRLPVSVESGHRMATYCPGCGDCLVTKTARENTRARKRVCRRMPSRAFLGDTLLTPLRPIPVYPYPSIPFFLFPGARGNFRSASETTVGPSLRAPVCWEEERKKKRMQAKRRPKNGKKGRETTRHEASSTRHGQQRGQTAFR